MGIEVDKYDVKLLIKTCLITTAGLLVLAAIIAAIYLHATGQLTHVVEQIASVVMPTVPTPTTISATEMEDDSEMSEEVNFDSAFPIAETTEAPVVFGPWLPSDEIDEVLEEEVVEEIYVPYYTSLGTFNLTAYCLCTICTECYSYGYESNGDNKNGTQVTANGSIPTYGRTIAADRRFPFGIEIYIEGLGWRTVEDRGGAIRGQRLDVFMPNHHLALSFGRQNREVRIRTADLDRVCPSIFEIIEDGNQYQLLSQ